MDDTITMENMHLAYKRIEDGIKDIDNKSFQMISIIGIMITLQVTIIPQLNTISTISLILSLITYFISVLLFIKAYILKNYMIYPTNKSVCYHYEYDVSNDEYMAGAVGDYDNVIKHNNEIIIEKGITSKHGFYCFIFGLFLTILTVGFMLV